jgi:CRISPR/Cas system endoribonuclease Cas6 (RAMP superfamily)
MTEEFREQFVENLRNALLKKYGKIPSYTLIANEFNLKANRCNPISPETAKRWLTGVSVPELHRLAVLCQVLNVQSEYFINIDNNDDLNI